jgi:hypothetical protein
MIPHVGTIAVQAVDGCADASQLLSRCSKARRWMEQSTYLCNFSKVFDDLAIALDYFLLDMEPDLAPGFCRVAYPSSIKRLQSIPDFEIGIGSGQDAGDSTGQGIGAP